MDSLKISVAQFEPKDGHKSVNLVVMEDLIRRARTESAELISFHDLCTTGYTFLKNLKRKEFEMLAEEIPSGGTTQRITDLARKYDIIVMAAILEKEEK